MPSHFRAILPIAFKSYPPKSWCNGRALFVRSELTSYRARCQRRCTVARLLRKLWQDERGQDIAEYAVMLAVVLVIVIGTVRLIGTNASTVFSQVGSSIGQ